MRNATFVVLFAILTAAAFAQRGGQRGNPGPPPGVQPLAVDLFTSKIFYKDKANWMDKRSPKDNAEKAEFCARVYNARHPSNWSALWP
ncbi:MAG TPA: hypothetical protein VFV44_11120 [Nitrospiraceae bacterium]|nr:hypothetical protein [Nitrospiraceae bacterium]